MAQAESYGIIQWQSPATKCLLKTSFGIPSICFKRLLWKNKEYKYPSMVQGSWVQRRVLKKKKKMASSGFYSFDSGWDQSSFCDFPRITSHFTMVLCLKKSSEKCNTINCWIPMWVEFLPGIFFFLFCEIQSLAEKKMSLRILFEVRALKPQAHWAFLARRWSF